MHPFKKRPIPGYLVLGEERSLVILAAWMKKMVYNLPWLRGNKPHFHFQIYQNKMLLPVKTNKTHLHKGPLYWTQTSSIDPVNLNQDLIYPGSGVFYHTQTYLNCLVCVLLTYIVIFFLCEKTKQKKKKDVWVSPVVFFSTLIEHLRHTHKSKLNFQHYLPTEQPVWKSG